MSNPMKRKTIHNDDEYHKMIMRKLKQNISHTHAQLNFKLSKSDYAEM